MQPVLSVCTCSVGMKAALTACICACLSCLLTSLTMTPLWLLGGNQAVWRQTRTRRLWWWCALPCLLKVDCCLRALALSVACEVNASLKRVGYSITRYTMTHAVDFPLQINAYMNFTSQNRLRQRTYAVDHHLRYGFVFKPMVKHPGMSRDRKPRVRWQHFHDVEPATGMENFPSSPVHGHNALAGPTAAGATILSVAPESHANFRSYVSMLRRDLSMPSVSPGMLGGHASNDNLERNDFSVLPMDLHRYIPAISADSSGFPPTFSAASSIPEHAPLGSRAPPSAAVGPALFPDVLR